MWLREIVWDFIVATLACLAAGSFGVVLAHEGSIHADDIEVRQLAPSAEEIRVVNALEHYAAAVESGDLEEIEKYVLTENVFTSLEGTNQEDSALQEDGPFLDQGWINYRKHLALELPMLNDSGYELYNIRPFVHGDLAYATMNYSMTFTIRSDQFKTGESRFTMKGKATMVLWKSDGEWKIRHRHTTAGKSTRHQGKLGSD